MNMYKRFFIGIYAFLIIFGVSVPVSFAQQVDIPKPPSLNCPVSLYDQARKVKSYSTQFSSLEAFGTFFTYYKTFVSSAQSLSGTSYYVLKFNTPNSAGWRLEYYEQSYELPTFPSSNSPTQTYPMFLGPSLPSTFMLTRAQVDTLNEIFIANPTQAPQLIQDIWLLRFFEKSCFEEINNLNTIPANPVTTGTTGYGKTRPTSQSFTIEYPGDLWTNTTAQSFTVAGKIRASMDVSPSLLVAYGARQNNLTHLAPVDGTLFFNSPMAAGDVITLPTLTIPISPIQSSIENNTVYFAIVDAVNTDISYTGTDSLTLGENTGLPAFATAGTTTTTAPAPAALQNGGLMKGICQGRIDPSDPNSPIGCTFNDLVRLFTNFWKFVLIIIIPIIAIMTAWIGFNFMQSGAEYREKAKEMFGNMVKGIILIMFAWFIVKTILDFTVGKNSCYSFLGTGTIDDNCLEKSN